MRFLLVVALVALSVSAQGGGPPGPHGGPRGGGGPPQGAQGGPRGGGGPPQGAQGGPRGGGGPPQGAQGGPRGGPPQGAQGGPRGGPRGGPGGFGGPGGRGDHGPGGFGGRGDHGPGGFGGHGGRDHGFGGRGGRDNHGHGGRRGHDDDDDFFSDDDDFFSDDGEFFSDDEDFFGGHSHGGSHGFGPSSNGPSHGGSYGTVAAKDMGYGDVDNADDYDYCEEDDTPTAPSGDVSPASNSNGNCGTLGAMTCSGTGFNTCDYSHDSADIAAGRSGQVLKNVYRDCAPGTACRPFNGAILCDWPQH